MQLFVTQHFQSLAELWITDHVTLLVNVTNCATKGQFASSLLLTAEDRSYKPLKIKPLCSTETSK